ncbi:dihydrofolate reductase family protein [Oenococcus sicerae]|uniref:dihydrofolate reductase family protein n=1 Tax=Oenococcus sicerae TaxID=2203724 RepID=UPI0010B69E49|nr:hypothetical protein OAL24_01100 [Oenococcus sicerae]
MAKLIYAINMSLDGYIEDAQGNLDWSISDDELFAFWTDFQRLINTCLYGRRMYESMVYWETARAESSSHKAAATREFAQLWQQSRKIVYSRTLQTVSSARTHVERQFDGDVIKKLKASSEADMSIGGAKLAGQAMHAGLVDELHLLVDPIILGGGKAALPSQLEFKLDLLNERRFQSGVVDLHYRVLV